MPLYSLTDLTSPVFTTVFERELAGLGWESYIPISFREAPFSAMLRMVELEICCKNMSTNKHPCYEFSRVLQSVDTDYIVTAYTTKIFTATGTENEPF